MRSGWYCLASFRKADLISSLLALVFSFSTAYGDLLLFGDSDSDSELSFVLLSLVKHRTDDDDDDDFVNDDSRKGQYRRLLIVQWLTVFL